jgi:hypothetical protein
VDQRCISGDRWQSRHNGIVFWILLSGLDERAKEMRTEWFAKASQVLENELGEEQLENLRAEAEGKMAEVNEKLGELNDALRVGEEEIEGIELPDIPGVPEGEGDGGYGLPSPLIDSEWEFAEQSRLLIAQRRYEAT